MSDDEQKLVFASANPGKIRELQQLLSPLAITLYKQADFNIDAAEETAVTFVENALLKARHAAGASGLPAIADDSGLEVDCLGGAPGLYSARYAQQHGAGEGDIANYTLLLQQLKHKTESERTARFRSVMVFLRHENDPAPIIAEGTWEGHILFEPEPGNGFGYDPVFCNHDTHTAASLLEKGDKNRLSHRGKAVQTLLQRMQNEWNRAFTP